MNPLAQFLINSLSPGLLPLVQLYQQALQPQQQVQQGPIAYPGGSFGGGQYLPQGGYQGGPIMGQPQVVQPQPYPSQMGPSQVSTPINFNPVIVQNQYNSLPLRATGGINATMNAATTLNANGMNVFH